MTWVNSDARLADDLASDSARGLESVYEAYSAKLYTYALTMLRDPAAAEDVVHDALLVAAGAIGQLRDRSKFRPWLYAITRNECLRVLRGRKRFSDADEAIDVPDHSVDFDAGLRREAAAQLLGQAMAALSPADRDIVALALQHDLDAERISEVTGTSANTVHARLSRARMGLSDAVSAVALFRTRGHCAELQAIISPPDQSLTPLLRKRILRHVKACDECEKRRRAAVAAMGPAMASPLYIDPPSRLKVRVMSDLYREQAQILAERAAPFDTQGFPVPLDARSSAKWLAPAVLAGGLLLLFLGTALLLVGRQTPAPTTAQTAIVSMTPSTSAPTSPSATASLEQTEPVEVTNPPAITVPDPVVPTARTRTSRPTPTLSTPAPKKSPSAKAPTPTPTPTKSAKSTKSAKPSRAPSSQPATSSPASTPAPAPEPPVVTSAVLTNQDLAEDGSFTRCDQFTLRIAATVTGQVDTVTALISPSDSVVVLAGEPLSASATLPPGEYSVAVEAIGPGGVARQDAGTVLHICPG